MNFESLSEKYREIKSPAEPISAATANSRDGNGLFEKIKKHDAYSKKQSKQFYIITSIVAVIYVFVFIINPDPNLTLQNRLAGCAFILASLILAFLFKKKHKKISNVVFLSSTKSFLEEARTRFQFWNRDQLWLILVVLLVDVASVFSISKYFELLSQTNSIIITQLIYFGLLIFGFFMGKKSWTKRKKPILEKIESMLCEFEQ
ncbi:hypothetical protein [uncultured Draconibacterium sp.]|uniref:hypothetical protein n=1 Tax=uncultured Draconibacterium sp. TaxID=1573823 RepID=UPI0029C68806|nr:hypothetical protein [uncultured Draconibacterium sp.]